jgi:hypothetical protein
MRATADSSPVAMSGGVAPFAACRTTPASRARGSNSAATAAAISCRSIGS